MCRINLVMFDMDGTLVDSMPSHAAAFGEVLNRRYGISAGDASEIYVKTSGMPVEVQFNMVLESKDLPRVENTADMEQEFWSLVLAKDPIVYPDVPPALEKLSKKGCSLYIISGSAPFVVEEKMKRCGLDKFFNLMLGSDTRIPGMTKGPGHLVIIQRKSGLSDEEFCNSSAIVGDAEHDMMVAKQAGVLGVARSLPGTEATLQNAGADYIIRSFTELESVLSKA